MPIDKDKKHMSAALKLAVRARGMTSPNPLVGAVLVKNGRVIGRGYHKKAGLPHAEIEAFEDARRNKKKITGSTLYVTLEPCCHTGKRTPPCTDAVVREGVSRVVIGAQDPNPKVRGNGVRKLRRSGIEVVTGVLEEKSREINEPYTKYITTGLPFVVLKLAATLDGKIAASTGDSKWIGSEAQRKQAHMLRSRADAVLVGINTVLTDNPSLNVRLKGDHKDPVPVVLDAKLRTPPTSNLMRIHQEPVIATVRGVSQARRKKLGSLGARVITVRKDKNGRIDLRELRRRLGELQFMSVLIEGGSAVAGQALRSGIVDKINFFYAPKIVGVDALSMIGPLKIRSIRNAIEIHNVSVKKIGSEFMVEGYVTKK